jgi:hypothetical protein
MFGLWDEDRFQDPAEDWQLTILQDVMQSTTCGKETYAKLGKELVKLCKSAGGRRGLVRVAPVAQPIQEHLLDRLIVRHENVANGVPTDKVANFFG